MHKYAILDAAIKRGLINGRVLKKPYESERWLDNARRDKKARHAIGPRFPFNFKTREPQ